MSKLVDNGASGAGMYSAGLPDRRELMSISRMCSEANAFRKPIWPLPFDDTAQDLCHQLNSLMSGRPGTCTQAAGDQLRATRKRLYEQVQTWLHSRPLYGSKEPLPERTTIPQFDEDGLLPPGISHVTWQQVVERFGYTQRRYRQLNGLLAAMHLQAAGGYEYAELGGSFVSAKADPVDIDCGWFSDMLLYETKEPMLDLSGEHPRLGRWANLRRGYFGLDAGKFGRDQLQRRTFTDAGYDNMDELGPIPYARLVGVVRLSLREPLPALQGFVPFSMWDEWSIHASDLAQLRARLPHHFIDISDQQLTAGGLRILPDGSYSAERTRLT